MFPYVLGLSILAQVFVLPVTGAVADRSRRRTHILALFAYIDAVTFAMVNKLTGSYRAAILSLVTFFIVGFVLLAAVDVRRAIVEAGNPLPERA